MLSQVLIVWAIVMRLSEAIDIMICLEHHRQNLFHILELDEADLVEIGHQVTEGDSAIVVEQWVNVAVHLVTVVVRLVTEEVVPLVAEVVHSVTVVALLEIEVVRLEIEGGHSVIAAVHLVIAVAVHLVIEDVGDGKFRG